MSLKLGDTNDTARRWRQVMAAMFHGYARTLGPLTTDTSVFGARAMEWQKEYERRTGQTVDGVVSDQDLADLKIVLPHRPIWIYTLPGSGAPWWVGPSFDLGEWAKHVLNINHQPVGTDIGGYLGLMGGDPSTSYNDIIAQEHAEFERLLGVNPDIDDPLLEIWVSAYSQSADGIKVAVNALFGDGGKYEHLRARINGLILLGDPDRQPGPTKIGNNPPGSGISRKVFPKWVNDLTWSITANQDFYAACNNTIAPLFYEWFVKAKTSLGFVVYCAQIIIPALLNLIAPFLGPLGGLTAPLAVPILAGASGLSPAALSPILGGVLGSTEPPNPELVKLLSVQGVLTNLPQLLALLAALPGIGVHGDYYSPRDEFGGRGGLQVGKDIMAGFRR